MKLIRFTLIFVLFLTSCNEKKTKINLEPFDLNNLSKDWVKLTEKDSGFIIFNSCDMGNSLLKIIGKDKGYELLLHGTQEDYEFLVLESTKLNDTIYINTKWKGSEEKQVFKFVWKDEKEGLGQWITTYSSGFTSENIFVSKNKQANFKTYDQSCRECWGDNCDELEK